MEYPLFPSQIKNKKSRLVQIAPGAWMLEDTYTGDYEYFPGKTLFRVENGVRVEKKES